MNTIIVIPARHGSSRFPGKPLAPVLGKPVLYRVWKIACSIMAADNVVIATDSKLIYDAAVEFGAKVVMTPTECQNGSERAFYAVEQLKVRPEIILNLQGDAILTPPWIIQAVIDELKQNSSTQIATPATLLAGVQLEEFQNLKATGHSSGTLVVFDLNRNALYFSKKLIPFIRDPFKLKTSPVYRHIGLYGYRYQTLKHYVSLDPSPLESVENLEQLRALEHGIPIKIVLVDYKNRTPWSIDNPDDIRIAEKLIQKEGELIP
jgi:3-deoxy-manno-octulosonate cytidylyltransferase (CMP-KDO synthetase)